jgi:hypothetical protein
MKQVIQEELEAVTKVGQPVRRPFGNYNYHNSGRYDGNTFQDVTDKYNITYKSQHPGEYGFNEVLYSEPHNILVAFPSEANEDFDQPYAIFGLKAARGYGKDHRFFDAGMEGSGVYRVSEEVADSLLQDSIETLKEIGSEYVKNFDVLHGAENLVRESKAPQALAEKAKALEKQGLEEVAEAGSASARSQVRERIAKNQTPPGWDGVPKQLAEKHPNTFGGDDPEANPHAVTWAIYANAPAG